MNKKRLLQKILMGSQNIRFNDLINLIEALGFVLDRVNGSHHIFKHPDVQELVNLQDVRGEAKPYQVRQVVELIEAYGLTLDTGAANSADEEQE
jgi:hypothetical protein